MMHKIIFLYFAAVILVSAVLTVTRRNPIHSVMFMLLLFFHIAGVFVLLNAEFLAAVQLIVYAGAILILYLFVVDAPERGPGESPRSGQTGSGPGSSAFGVLIAGEIVLLVLARHVSGRGGPDRCVRPAYRGRGTRHRALHQLPGARSRSRPSSCSSGWWVL